MCVCTAHAWRSESILGSLLVFTFHRERGFLCFYAANARLASPGLGPQLCPTNLSFCWFILSAPVCELMDTVPKEAIGDTSLELDCRRL